MTYDYEYDLKLTDELENYKICDRCISYIFTPFYSCTHCKNLKHLIKFVTYYTIRIKKLLIILITHDLHI